MTNLIGFDVFFCCVSVAAYNKISKIKKAVRAARFFEFT
jgi:hypothetical protein